MTHQQVDLSRRRFTAAASAGALIIGCHLPFAAANARPANVGADAILQPNAFVRVGADNIVTVMIKHIEFGQGPTTGLATLVAEEMDAAWDQVRGESAPANGKLYGNPVLGGIQGTGGSNAMASSYLQMREAGAVARAMLVAAAAQVWTVPADRIQIRDGIVSDGKKRRATFGELAAVAAHQSVPEKITLKEPEEFRLIGKKLPKLDTLGKTNGTTEYTIDLYRPNMLTVLIARPPKFGATFVSGNLGAVRVEPGVRYVKAIPQGVAVYAESFWQARQAREKLEIEWDETKAETRSTKEIAQSYRELARSEGLVASARGDTAGALKRAKKRVVAEYEFPFLAHAPMEPLDGVMEMRGGEAHVWMGSQIPSLDQTAMAKLLGLKTEQVHLDVMISGGSFGRRAQKHSDFALELAHVSKAIDGKVPVKLMWTREDDIRGGNYRPMYVHRLEGAVDEQGQIEAWNQVIVGQSIQKGTMFAEFIVKDGVDMTSVEGASNLVYDTPNLNVSLHSPEVGVPVLWWRSVGHTHTGYAAETFVDELIHEAGQDAIKGRLALLGDDSQHRQVLEAVAKAANWKGPKGDDGSGYGVAVHKSFGTVVAQIAKVRLDSRGQPKVERVWCAVDCGRAVNPDIVVAQMEGGIGYGLSAAMYNQVDIEGGVVQQANFDTYRSLRLPEMPQIDVTIIDSDAAPTGVGEPGVPPIAPAVANALFQLTGERIRRLPFIQHFT